MKVALLTEGTYPFHAGGVSVWCDQLVRGLPEHQFHVVAVTSDAALALATRLPRNVVQVTRVPVWGSAPPQRRGGQGASRRFLEVYRHFVASVVNPDGEDAVPRFAESLAAMYRYGQEANLGAALLSNEALGQLSSAWHEAGARPGRSRSRGVAISFADALTAADLMEHFLRPLSFVPPEADVYHAASNGLCALIGLAAKWQHGVPLVLTEHGIYLRERYLSNLDGPGTHVVKSLLLGFFRLLSSAVYEQADAIRPASDYNQRWQIRNGADPRRIGTIYNGIDVSAFTPDLGEPEAPTISWLGRIDPLKDLETLIRAFRHVKERLPEARLRIFGSAPSPGDRYLSACMDLVARLRLNGSARFEGRVAHPADAYRAGTIVALSSVSEGLPFTLIEAMASGKAVVATRVGGVREAVGDAGLLVAPRDDVGMAEACVRLLTDPCLRRELGARARQRALERFTVEQTLEAYRGVYRQLGSSVRTPRPGPQDARMAPSAAWRPT
ncbi:MAG TPA: GT4 family glycosyltransferase PelF [Trueperaceae bacterium]|nr:GT4 family glycosyltransferase PelF [Trueperaceae bacterium]